MNKSNEIVMSTRGRIVIPKDVRDSLGIRTRSKMLLHRQGKTLFLIPKPKNTLKAILDVSKHWKLGDLSKEIKEHRKDHRSL